MKMKILIFILCFFSFSLLNAQEIYDELIVSSGYVIDNQSVIVDWVVGNNLLETEWESIKLGSGTTPDFTNGQENFILFPSVTKDWIFLEQISETISDFRVNILDIHGKVIQSEEFSTDRMKINLEEYQPGLYLIILDSSGNSTGGKFKVIKQ